MGNGPNRGLAGKARRARYRSRASRLYAQQLITDYLDPEAGRSQLQRNRLIPIRRRREFLPSAAPACDGYIGTQLELPLTDAELIADGTIRIKPRATPRAKYESNRPCNGKTTVPSRDAARVKDVPAIEEPALSMGVTAGQGVADSSEAFTLRGFLCGCAVGGAAAAMILLAFHFALG